MRPHPDALSIPRAAESTIAPRPHPAKIRAVILPAIFLAAAAVAACGFLGAAALPPQESTSFAAGALTLAGALLICALFALHARWHGIGGAAVVALAGLARNIDSLLPLSRAAASQLAPPPGELHRAAIAALCLALFFLTARALLAERRRRHHPAP